MIKSMTGFGRGEYSDGTRVVSVELKSVNHRYNEIFIRMSKKYGFAEEIIKNIIKGKVKRGKIDVAVGVEYIAEGDVTVDLNIQMAKQYFKNLREIQSEFDVSGDISLELLAGMPDVMKVIPDVKDEDEVVKAINEAVQIAVSDFDDMRSAEGEKLADDIKKRGEILSATLDKIEKKTEGLNEVYAEKFKERIAELLDGNIEIPEERITLEAAVVADKATITEEIVRLRSHLKQLADIIDSNDETKGKKLDFLVQEINRETNTIGSKANDLDITNLMLEMKSETEKIREQVQNIE